MKNQKKILFFIYILILGIIDSSYLFSELLWDDDKAVLKDYYEKVENLKAEKKYMKYSGTRIAGLFFKENLFNSYIYPKTNTAINILESKEAIEGTKCLRVDWPKFRYSGIGLFNVTPLDLKDKYS